MRPRFLKSVLHSCNDCAIPVVDGFMFEAAETPEDKLFNLQLGHGTGKTICAEAIANSLGMKLLVVNYAEVESMWAGETPKNIVAAFRSAAEQRALLFFDEADAIAGRRSTAVASLPYQREANITVNVLLHELEAFNGVVIFATNLAANFDPAFERRIRAHVRFEMPGVEEREQIWRVQIHPSKTPLARDVDFRALAEEFAVSGGDIKNAVLKAAAAAAADSRSERAKQIHQEHFERAMADVIAAKAIMQQSLFRDEDPFVRAIATMQRRMYVSALIAATSLIVALIALTIVLIR